MSLIEEALRKQREETEKARGGLTMQAPPPLPEQEDEPSVEEPAPGRKAVPVLIAAVAGGILILAAIVWLLMYGVNLRAGKEVKSVKPDNSGRKVEAVDRKETKVASGVATSPAPVLVTVTQAVAVVPVPTQAVSVVVAPVVTSAPVVVAEVVVTGEAAVAKTEVLPAVQKITVAAWPRLTITGLIGAGRGGKSAAIINGQMVLPGATIEGVKVEAISRQGVKLSFEGESRTLIVGGSTE